ncbi:MAG TPA: hypothetical protein VN253_13300, partial [Kofleriaceae bacterium]|nr:hypothetical protein [Kofleriaceae bacterium]
MFRLLLLLSSGAALASPPPRAVTFDEALGLTGELPAIAAEREAAAGELSLKLPRAWTPSLVLATPQGRLAPRDARGLEGGLSVQQAIPLDDVNGARRAHVDAIARVYDARAAAAALEARLATAAAWIDGWAARERLGAAR